MNTITTIITHSGTLGILACLLVTEITHAWGTAFAERNQRQDEVAESKNHCVSVACPLFRRPKKGRMPISPRNSPTRALQTTAIMGFLQGIGNFLRADRPVIVWRPTVAPEPKYH
jgi:hypothetical protein